MYVDTLLTARWMLPTARSASVLEWHSVAIHQGCIVALCPREEAQQRFQPGEIIERSNHLVLPGLVNAHLDVVAVIARGLRSDRSKLQELSSDPEFVSAAADLAFAQSVRAGVTTVAAASPYPAAVARSASAARVRCSVGLIVQEGPTPWADSAGECLSRGLELRDEYREDPWISTHFAIAEDTRPAPEVLERIQRTADELEMPVSVALDARYCGIELLSQHRLLTPLLVVRSGGTLPEHCLDELAGADAHLVGATALLWEQAQVPGLHLCLGSVADQRAEADLWEIFHKTVWSTGALRADWRDSGLHAATQGGAHAVGMAERLGAIAPERWADLVCIDLDRVHMRPFLNPIEALTRGGTRSAVCDVWIGGSAVLENGELIRMDEHEVIQRAQTQLELCR